MPLLKLKGPERNTKFNLPANLAVLRMPERTDPCLRRNPRLPRQNHPAAHTKARLHRAVRRSPRKPKLLGLLWVKGTNPALGNLPKYPRKCGRRG